MRLVLLLLGACGTAVATVPIIVDLGYAKYEGIRNETLGVQTHYGIRYAKSPTGDLRWRAPVPVDSPGTKLDPAPLNATRPGPICFQGIPGWYLTLKTPLPPLLPGLIGGGGLGGPGGIDLGAGLSEDCLTIDVITPLAPLSNNLPVLVSIHGGGYVGGYASGTPGHNFVAEAKGSVIFVQIQYRLGISGFLSSKELRANGKANAGLLDQRAALEWIQRHIHHFGGDAAKVTIWGGSGGGGSVLNHLIWEGGVKEAPFRAAIPEFPWTPPYHSNDILETQYSDLLEETKCSNLQCLRLLPADKLSQASLTVYKSAFDKGHYAFGDTWFGPTVDGEVIKDLPSNEFKNGHFHKVPLLTLRNRHEGYSFSDGTIDNALEVSAWAQKLWPTADLEFMAKISSIYPESSYGAAYLQANPTLQAALILNPQLRNNRQYFLYLASYSDYIINCPTYAAAKAFSEAGMPVWKTRFNAGSGLHGASTNYILGSPNSTSNSTLAASLKSYWLSFIVNLDPNLPAVSSVAKPEWPKYNKDSSKTTILDIYDKSMATSIDPDANEACRFYINQNGIVRN